ncbi:MAG: GNAT family N-acetyltransferase [Desulfobacterales bacterium]|nr:GNAT family N-acetyltransferase [Desulfobacterales bacterium]
MPNQNDSPRYEELKKSGEEAMAGLRPGQRVFIGSGCGEPQYLVNTLLDLAGGLFDLEIVRLLSLESSLVAMMAEESQDRLFNVRSIYLGSGQTRSLQASQRFIAPMPLSAVPRIFIEGHLPLDLALVQVSPPDRYGWMNLGISVDVTLAAAQSAAKVVAQVNPRMPRVPGQGFIHMDQVDAVVEEEEALHSAYPLEAYAAEEPLARLAAGLVEDGATLHLGLGTASPAVALALADKNDLGIHTEILTDGLLDLAFRGVVTNKYKAVNRGKSVAGSAIGTEALYAALNDNPAVEFRPSDFVNNPAVIRRHRQMTSICVAGTIDLTGQVMADALPQNHFSGVTGMLDFAMGAHMARDGRLVILVPALSGDGRTSRIVPALETGSVVIPRGYVSHVVSEYGTVNLFGKNMEERAMAMISLAHPDHRESLFDQAKTAGLIGRRRSLKESLFGVYPQRMEEKRTYGEHKVVFRPAKPTDSRMIQEHFYQMDAGDVEMRFFSLRRHFYRDEMEDMAQVDYVKNLSVVAVTGEIGFERIVGLGGYFLEGGTTAEVAFSVDKKWQGKGIGRVIIRKLAAAARENGITTLTAYTLPNNRGMLKLFKKLPYATKSAFEDDAILLTCDLKKPEPTTHRPQ